MLPLKDAHPQLTRCTRIKVKKCTGRLKRSGGVLGICERKKNDKKRMLTRISCYLKETKTCIFLLRVP